MTAAADRHLLFGLLALQNGLIDQVQLVAAFQAWTRDKSRSLADHLEARGDLTGAKRTLLELLADAHLEAHGGDVEKSLAAVPANHSTRAGLAALGVPEIEATLARVTRSRNGQATEADDDPDRTSTLSVGAATSEGQRFRVLRPHARGGLGEVFVALDAELHREVALKQILEKHADDPVSRQRFVAEAEITGGLEHPGVVPVYGLGTYGGGRPYYAMRFINGDSLKEAIEHFHRDDALKNDPGRRSLELRKLLRRFLDVCNAIDYAHSRGVIHRDLKPANIILGKHGETLVVDWGLAKLVGRADPSVDDGEQTIAPSSSGSSETLPGSALGTPAYMSPEQAGGHLDRLGPRSDVYSLGATLYCLPCGKPPFEGEDVGEILRRVQAGDVRAPREIAPALDKALEAVCLRAMAHRPADRYDSPRVLAADIDHWLAGEPVSAWHEPWLLPVRRWIRRHQAAATGVAAVVVVAAAGLMAVSIVQAEANRDLHVPNSRLTNSLTHEARANEALRDANARERASREQAQRRFGLARQAIEQYYTGASEDVLLKQPELEALRNKLLGTSLGFYKRLQAELEGSGDPATRSELAAAYLRVGEITAQVGQTSEVLEAYEQARVIDEALVRADPSADGSRRDLSRSLEHIGNLLLGMNGRAAEGLQRLESALALRQALAAGPSDPADDRLSIALIHQGTAVAQQYTGSSSAALRSLEQARDVAERLLADRPGDAAVRQDLAAIYRHLAARLRIMGRPDVSLRSMERGLALQEQLAAEHPDDVGYREKLGGALTATGIDLTNTRRLAESLPYFQRALEVHRRLEADYPAHTGYRYLVARTHLMLGVSFSDLGRMAEALKEMEPAAAILERVVAEHPGMTSFRNDLAFAQMCLARAHKPLGRPADARRELEQAHSIYERQPPDAVTLYNLACTESLLSGLAMGSERDAYAVRAIVTLRRAFAAGFRDLNSFRKDEDLDPLRSRPDFQALLLDLAFPDQPFAP